MSTVCKVIGVILIVVINMNLSQTATGSMPSPQQDATMSSPPRAASFASPEQQDWPSRFASAGPSSPLHPEQMQSRHSPDHGQLSSPLLRAHPRPPPPDYRHNTPEPDPEVDSEVGDTEGTGASKIPRFQEIAVTQYFINAMKEATLEDSGMSREAIMRLRNPSRHTQRVVTPFDLCGIRMYLARGDASEQNYTDHRFAQMELHPEDNIPSHEQIKRTIVKLTGLEPLVHEMC